MSRALDELAAEVGGPERGPVCVRGGATQWLVGGAVAPGTREVVAPNGIAQYHPAEMTVRVGAGTPVVDLHAALAEHAQRTVLDGPPGATVGGVLAVGHGGPATLRHGALRDVLLEARYVSADGRVVVAGGPTVKNVTGFDLCRLLVGSLGTLGLLGEVVLRTRPMPEASCWLAGVTDPFALLARLYRPAAVLWDATTTWVHLEGYEGDVEAQAAVCAAAGLTPVAGAPDRPPRRLVHPPGELAALVPRLAAQGAVLAELGVGVVHAAPGVADQPRPVDARARALAERLRDEFDPTRRLNPGRDPFARV